MANKPLHELKETSFTKVNTRENPQHIVDAILNSKAHQLIIPPRFEEMQLEIPEPTGDLTSVGLFSSGSTGKPKCIWNTRQNLLLNGELSRERFNLSIHDRVLIIASPWHVAGLTWALMAQLAGVPYKVVVPKTQENDQWSDQVRDFKPTYLFTVPTVLRYLVQDDNWWVKNIAYGGASINPELYDELGEHGDTLYQAYGQTEAGGLIASHLHHLDTDPYEYESICCGVPPEGVMIQCDSTDAVEPAPIQILSKTAIHDGWYDSGDVGFINDQGDLHITGRKEQKHGNCNMISSVTSVVHK